MGGLTYELHDPGAPSPPAPPPAPGINISGLPAGSQVPGGFIQPSGGFAPTSGPGFPSNTSIDTSQGVFQLPPQNPTATGAIATVPFPVIGGGGQPNQFVTGGPDSFTFAGVPSSQLESQATPLNPVSFTGNVSGALGPMGDVSNSSFDLSTNLATGGAVQNNAGTANTQLGLSPDLTPSLTPEFTTATGTDPTTQLALSPDLQAVTGTPGSLTDPLSTITSGTPGLANIPGSPLPVPGAAGSTASGFWADVVNVMQRVGLVLVGIVLLGAAAYAMSRTDLTKQTKAAFT